MINAINYNDETDEASIADSSINENNFSGMPDLFDDSIRGEDLVSELMKDLVNKTVVDLDLNDDSILSDRDLNILNANEVDKEGVLICSVDYEESGDSDAQQEGADGRSKCPICGKSFLRLNTHMSKMHKPGIENGEGM